MLRQPPLPQRMVQERRDFLRVGLGRVPGTVGDIGFKIFFIDGRKVSFLIRAGHLGKRNMGSRRLFLCFLWRRQGIFLRNNHCRR